MRTRYFLAGMLLALVLVTGITLVRAQTADPTYYACVNNSSGTIFIITAEQSCKSSEYRIVWNATGPAGPQGLQGEPGPAGLPAPENASSESPIA